MNRRIQAGMAAASGAILWCWAASAKAHQEALFGPESSLAVEWEGFVSLQAHEHVFGLGSTHDQETNYILRAGVSPFRSVPWSLTLVQSFTYENARTPQGDQTGPISSCGGCVAVESLSWRNTRFARSFAVQVVRATAPVDYSERVLGKRHL